MATRGYMYFCAVKVGKSTIKQYTEYAARKGLICAIKERKRGSARLGFLKLT